MIPKTTSCLTLLALVLALPACDVAHDELDDELMMDDRDGLVEADESPTKPAPKPAPAPDPEPEPESNTLLCDPDLFASVGGLYYPANWDCASAIADAESNLGSWHYRNACNQQVGSDIADPVDGASVTSCQVDISGQILVTVDLCCTAPAFTCDPALQAAVGGLYYPGWTCADAIANAEATLGSWHYRNACNQQVGSDIADPVAAATVTACDLDPYSGDPVVTVDLCCADPGFTCDPAMEASVGGIYYPGWTCADAIANAEATLGSYHYRNACSQQVGSDINDPVAAATVTACDLDPYTGDPVITADLCCS